MAAAAPNPIRPFAALVPKGILDFPDSLLFRSRLGSAAFVSSFFSTTGMTVEIKSSMTEASVF
jgi:hypothetical protein